MANSKPVEDRDDLAERSQALNSELGNKLLLEEKLGELKTDYRDRIDRAARESRDDLRSSRAGTLAFIGLAATVLGLLAKLGFADYVKSESKTQVREQIREQIDVVEELERLREGAQADATEVSELKAGASQILDALSDQQILTDEFVFKPSEASKGKKWLDFWIDFKRPFANRPTVFPALRGFDISEGRADVAAEVLRVEAGGFELRVKGNIQSATAFVQWMAIGREAPTPPTSSAQP
ncbi:MAG: H-type lectin domain-containing protein [Acidobacteriota bacterium]